MYVEGFLKLNSENEGQCDLSIPFLGFYGDWSQAPMLDYTAYEVAENAQDASVADEDKIKASVWETLPYSSSASRMRRRMFSSRSSTNRLDISFSSCIRSGSRPK